MRVRIDRAKCQGHARCNAAAPEVFGLDELGYGELRSDRSLAEFEALARQGAAACPERAITIEADSTRRREEPRRSPPVGTP